MILILCLAVVLVCMAHWLPSVAVYPLLVVRALGCLLSCIFCIQYLLQALYCLWNGGYVELAVGWEDIHGT